MKIPEFVTKQEFIIRDTGPATARFGPSSDIVLPSGSHVKPVRPCYLPKDFKATAGPNEIYVYCRFGIIAIPKELVVQV